MISIRYLKTNLSRRPYLFRMLVLLLLLPSGAWPDTPDWMGGDGSDGDSRMIHLTATGSAVRNVVTVEWETRIEPGISGFFVWRSQQRDRSYTRFHNTMILSKGGATRGGFYTFDDYDVVSGRTYYYKIQEIEESGVARFYGPVASDGSIDWDETCDKSRILISCFIHSLF
jgi:hypothetical protein